MPSTGFRDAFLKLREIYNLPTQERHPECRRPARGGALTRLYGAEAACRSSNRAVLLLSRFTTGIRLGPRGDDRRDLERLPHIAGFEARKFGVRGVFLIVETENHWSWGAATTLPRAETIAAQSVADAGYQV